MNDIKIISVTEKNKQECLNLIVKENQKDYLPSISESLELAKRYPNAFPKAIVTNNKVIGFCLYGIDNETTKWKIYRFLIDESFQSKGLGKKALRELIKLININNASKDILVCYQDSNIIARNLYSFFGFIEYSKQGTKIFAKLNNNM